MNLQFLEPIMREGLGLVRADLGAFDEAREIVQTALTAAIMQGDVRVEGRCHHALALIDTRAGRFQSAETEARAAVAKSVSSVLPLAVAGLAAALLGQGRAAEALAQAREANRLLDEQGYVEDGEALVRIVLVDCLRAAGEVAEAKDFGVRAYRRLMERAGMIDQPDWRASFLALPDHRHTLEVAAALGLASV
jgi:tetratricopeptide (TPR) repeat protein